MTNILINLKRRMWLLSILFLHPGYKFGGIADRQCLWIHKRTVPCLFPCWARFDYFNSARPRGTNNNNSVQMPVIVQLKHTLLFVTFLTHCGNCLFTSKLFSIWINYKTIFVIPSKMFTGLAWVPSKHKGHFYQVLTEPLSMACPPIHR